MFNRIRQEEIKNGNLINADDLAAEFDNLYHALNVLAEQVKAMQDKPSTFS